MTLIFIAATALITSIISGIIGMAGGIILMAVYLLLLPVAGAMILHGVTQFAANGYRAFLHRHHIPWSILPGYLLGALIAWSVFEVLLFVPDKGVIYVIIGLFPWLAFFMPGNLRLNIQRPLISALAGVTVTAAQLLAGASGPLLDVFYQKSPLQRHAIVAGKALTQSLGHLIKLGYYAQLVTLDELSALTWWIYPLVVILAVAGTFAGSLVLNRITEKQFRRASEAVILALGALMIISGSAILLA